MSGFCNAPQVRGALIVGSLLVAVPRAGLQALQPRSLSGLPPDDRSAITELAQQVGIDDPQLVVAYNFIDADHVWPTVKVESRPIVDGRRVISQQLWLRRDKSLGCAHVPMPRRSIRHRNWLTTGLSQQIVRWRLRWELACRRVFW